MKNFFNKVGSFLDSQSSKETEVEEIIVIDDEKESSSNEMIVYLVVFVIISAISFYLLNRITNE